LSLSKNHAKTSRYDIIKEKAEVQRYAVFIF